MQRLVNYWLQENEKLQEKVEALDHKVEALDHKFDEMMRIVREIASRDQSWPIQGQP